MKYLSLRKIVPDCTPTPRFYGCAYYLVDECVSVAYPVPLHKLVGWLRYLWILVKRPPRTFRLAVLQAQLHKKQLEIEELRRTLYVYQEREHWRNISPN